MARSDGLIWRPNHGRTLKRNSVSTRRRRVEGADDCNNNNYEYNANVKTINVVNTVRAEREVKKNRMYYKRKN